MALALRNRGLGASLAAIRAWRRGRRREAPLVDFQDADDFEKWLEGKPREVAVALAARSALRVLPFVWNARPAQGEGDLRAVVVLRTFRATGVAWSAAKYADQATRSAADAAATAADVFTNVRAAAAATAAAQAAAAGYAAAAALRSATYAAAALRSASYAAATAFWSALSGDAARSDEGARPFDIAGSRLWLEAQPPMIAELWLEMKRDLLVVGEDWDVWTDWYEARLRGDPAVEELEIARANIPDEIWKQGLAVVNAEIKRLVELYSTPTAPPDPLPQQKKFIGFFSYAHSDTRVDPTLVEALSSELEKRVDAKIVNATFEMWRDNTKLRNGDYWDDTIETAIRSADVMVVLMTPKWISSDYCRKEFGSFREQEADRGDGSFVIPIYVRNVDDQVHDLTTDQRAVYDDLMRRQHKRTSPTEFLLLSDGQRVDLIERIADDIVLVLSRRRAGEPARPRPVQGVVSPTSFDWTPKETISIGAGPANWPAFPFPNSENDHANLLEASKVKANDIIKGLKKQRWNARPDYLDALENYVERLPVEPRTGNFLLAENEYQIIRALFTSEAGFLPDGLAAQLGMFVTNHTALRPYYPDATEFIESARRGSLEPTLPLEAFEGLSKVLQKHTPTKFEPEVGESLGATVQPLPSIPNVDDRGQTSVPGPLAPPPDPIGETDPEKSHRLTMASWVNELVKVVESGDKVKKGAEGWRDVANEMAPFAAPIIQFLRNLLGG
jgi:hypothetical protein